ncbi:MAG: ATP-binding protein [Candidatus Zixiibacteriota bacterium]
MHFVDIADFCFGDIDADGEEEFLRLFSSRRGFQVCRFSRERLLGPAIYQGNTAHKIESIMFAEVDSIPGCELVMTLRDISGDSLWIEVCDGHNPKHILCKTQAVIGKDISDRDNFFSGGWGASADNIVISDINADGINEIIAPVSVGFDLYPRGIYTYAFPSGELLWWFPLAGNPQKIEVADVNRDGYQEIFFKTWACSNGAVQDGRSDDSSYAFALDYKGDSLWAVPLGDRFDVASHDVLVCDCDADGTWEIYYTMLMRTDEFDRQVMVLEKHRARDNQFIRQHSFDAGSRYSEIAAVRFNPGGPVKLLLNNRPTILNAQYLTIETTGDLSEICGLRQVVDIDPENDNGTELLYSCRDSLYILWEDLSLRALFGEAASATIGRVRYFTTPFGDQYVAIISAIAQNNSQVTQLNIYEMKPSEAIAHVWGISGIKLWIAAAILLAVGFLLGYSLKSRVEIEKRIDKSRIVQLQNLHTLLITFEHGQMAARNLNRLLFLLSNLPQDLQKLNEIGKNLYSAIDAYQSYTSKQLDNIYQLGRKIKELKPSMRKIARANNALTGIFATIDKNAISKIESGQNVKEILGHLQELSSIVRSLKSFIASRLSVDLLDCVPKVLTAFSGRLRDEGVILKKLSGSGLLTKHIFFSEAEFAAVIEELLSNACRAMKSSPVKELQMMVCEDKDAIVVKIQDTGCGFPRENPAIALERGYSERDESGGFGLYYVRQQIERFGGRIKLVNNDDGIGATVILTLKAVANG